MINGKRVIAIVPARGGSKGLPDKNLRPLAGKPLIAWSIEQGSQASTVDLVLLTTDSEQIAEVGRRHGATVPFLRPAELATDESPTVDAVRHALSFLRDTWGQEFDYVVLLEPTSPLRTANDIDAMVAALDATSDFDSIVSVGEIAEHPAIVKRLRDGQIAPFCPELPPPTRRQDLEPAYFPYGVAYIAKTDALLGEGTFYTSRCTAFTIKRYQCYEIDDIYDFLCVEAVMTHEWGL